MPKAISAKQYRLLSMPKAQCRVYLKRFDDGGVTVKLFSYSTGVLTIRYNPDTGAALYCSGTYSVTTARHINRFTKEFCGENKYYECKSAIYNPNLPIAFDWYYVCDVEPKRLLKMCERYESEARVYNGRY